MPDKSKQDGAGQGFLDKIKGLFAKEENKRYSDDFAQEKEIIANYKAKLEDNAPALESPDKPGKSPEAKLYAKPRPKPAPEAAPPAPAEAGRQSEQDRKKPAKFSLPRISANIKKPDNAWQAPKMVTTNLIQSEIMTYVDWTSRIKMAALAVISPLLITFFLYLGLIYRDIQTQSQANILGTEIESISRQVEAAEKNVSEVDNFKAKLALIENLLDKHVYWTRFFAFLEQNILSEAVILGGFSGDTKGDYNFNITSPAYGDVLEQVMVLRNNSLVERAEILEARQGSSPAGAASPQAAISYNLKLKLDPSLFYRSR